MSNLEGVGVYLNDIIVICFSAQKLMGRLDFVLTKISQAGFQLKLEK